ncbi:hypothetical protein PYW07_003778 [Mythimna separata]|uniref:IML22 n=1 Tax=Mythimna separata TaxID=271217 RepID=A0A8F3C7D1_MYTSE|nr:hypothetical protein PYW07_003778 [Mythimna separata]QWY13119.1 IML22 [Mythimna separata]
MMSCLKYFVFLFYMNLSEGEFRCDYKYGMVSNGWYKYHPVPMVWSDARLRCAQEGATLASPATPALKNEMITVLKDYDPKREIFTGIHATFASGDHHTIEGIALSDISVVWAENEPDNKDNKENCITFDVYGHLADRPCDDTRPFMCYRPENSELEVNECGTFDPEYRLDNRTNKCYKFHPVPRNFSRASLTCSAEGGHLAVINSYTEAVVLTELLARYPKSGLLHDYVEVVNGWKETAVVGIYDWGEHGDWRTIHGQTLAEAGYDKWNQNKPTSLPGTFCGSLWRNGLLTDVVCDKNFAFICEKSPQYPDVCNAEAQKSILWLRI